MAKGETLLVEFGDDRCRNYFFPPLDRRLRGRFDAQQLAKHDRDAGALIADWPEAVAGQQLEIDNDTGEAAIVEPLHDFPSIAARLHKSGLQLAPRRESVTCDLPTLLYYTRDAVKSGAARIVRGALPEFDESKARLHLFVEPPLNQTAELAKAFNRLADVMEKMLAKK